MNCKPGDIAVVVSGFPQNIGGLVRVIAADPNPADHRHWWKVEALSVLSYALERNDNVIVGRLALGEETHIADACIRPILDQPGADETLTWKDVPAPIKTPEPA